MEEGAVLGEKLGITLGAMLGNKGGDDKGKPPALSFRCRRRRRRRRSI